MQKGLLNSCKNSKWFYDTCGATLKKSSGVGNKNRSKVPSAPNMSTVPVEKSECESFQRKCFQPQTKISVCDVSSVVKNCGCVNSLFVFLAVICCLTTVSGLGDINNELRNSREDVFSSTSKLEQLVHNELQVLDLLSTFTDYTIEKASLIKT